MLPEFGVVETYCEKEVLAPCISGQMLIFSVVRTQSRHSTAQHGSGEDVSTHQEDQEEWTQL